MANNQQGPSPQGSLDPLQFKKQLKALLEDQGDYNNLLKDAIRDLRQLDNAYDKISARLSTMERSTVNLKEVGKELYDLKQKEFLEVRKMEKLEKELGKEAADQYKNIKAQAEEYAKQNAARGKKVDVDKTIMALAQKTGNLELISLRAQERLIELAGKKKKEGELALETEKKVGKQIGITGNLFKIFTEKLGVGEEAYEAMTAKARDLVDANGKVTGFGGKLKVIGAGMKAVGGQIKESITDPAAIAAGMVGAYKLAEAGLNKVGQAAEKTGEFVAGLSESSGNVVRGLAAPVADLVSNIPLVGGLLSGMMKGFAGFLDLLLGVDDAVIKMGRQLNMSRGEAQALNKQFAEMSLRSGDIFVNSKKLFESQVELSDQLGINNILSAEQLETNNKLKEFAGLEASTRAKIAESSIITGKSSEKVVQSVISQVAGLKKATGISFNYQKILGEASSLGGVLGLQFAKYPEKLTKALVSTKALGMELKTLDGMADSFLDFESSITKEFEAQLLTGKNINLTKARELFLNNDLAGAALEITKQVGSSEEFLKMNMIEAESYAQAMGMSRDQMAEMLKQQELLSKFGAKDTKDLQDKVAALRAQGREQEAINMLGSEQLYQNMVNASTQEKMMAFIEKIKQSIVDFLQNSGIIEKIQGFVDYLTQPGNVKAIIAKVQGFVADAVEFISKAAYYIVEALDYVAFGQIPDDFIEGIKAGGASMGAQIRSMGQGGGAEAPPAANNVGGKVAAQSTAQTQGGFANTGQKVDRGAPSTINVYTTMEMSDRTTTNKTSTFVTNDKSQTFGP
jgi:hypothetical protein